MKDHRLTIIGIIVVFTACITKSVETEHVELSSSSGQLGPYPVSSSHAPPISNPPGWKCGYEIITVEGPNGEVIGQEIPLECNPFADIYMGDPAPKESIENEIKKAPYETGPDLTE